jgi:hypothetical protein
MKTLKLLRKAEEILNAKKSKQRSEKKCLQEVLGKLKKRKHKLRDKLKNAGKSSERERIRKEMAIIHAQRKKGLKALKDLK